MNLSGLMNVPHAKACAKSALLSKITRQITPRKGTSRRLIDRLYIPDMLDIAELSKCNPFGGSTTRAMKDSVCMLAPFSLQVSVSVTELPTTRGCFKPESMAPWYL